MFSVSARFTAADFSRLVDEQLPLMGLLGYRVEHLAQGEITLRMPFNAKLTRPGGTIAGPAIMALADLAVYGALLSAIGPQPLAVTTNLNCNFLRRPRPVDLIAHGSLLKTGKRLAIGEVTLYSDGDEAPVAHVTCTYSIPPR